MDVGDLVSHFTILQCSRGLELLEHQQLFELNHGWPVQMRVGMKHFSVSKAASKQADIFVCKFTKGVTSCFDVPVRIHRTYPTGREQGSCQSASLGCALFTAEPFASEQLGRRKEASKAHSHLVAIDPCFRDVLLLKFVGPKFAVLGKSFCYLVILGLFIVCFEGCKHPGFLQPYRGSRSRGFSNRFDLLAS